MSYLVSTKGIEASLNKIKAILQMQPLQTRKEVQKLAGRVPALNRFIVKLAERSLPFFSILRGSTKVEWVTVYPVFKPKSNAHSMCAQESSLHTYHTENGYRITNVTIYNIFTK